MDTIMAGALQKTDLDAAASAQGRNQEPELRTLSEWEFCFVGGGDGGPSWP
jgi:hypothetical protein